MPPQKQAEYELYKRIKLLGEGSFGKAYLVECLQDKTLWVIKYMDLAAMTTAEKEETLRESKILEFLQHPNIVKFREVYKTKKGKLCIVMEYADGGDIGLKIKQAKGNYFSENQILDWFTQICLAIKHVHDRKIIHRDLKGQNIFLQKDNTVKLGDFGIARILKKTIEKAKTMVGTPYYISPEIIEGKPYTFMTDIWSLGVILYELCALQPPFNADSLHFLALKIVKGQYSPIPNHYSKELKNLVQQLLCTDQRRRPTIQEVLKMPVITNRIKGFLTETIRKQEFSHTVLHNRAFEPKGNLGNINLILNEQPCPPQFMEKNIQNLQEFPQIKPQDKKPEMLRPEPQKPSESDLLRPPNLGQQKARQPDKVVKPPEQPKKLDPIKKDSPLQRNDVPKPTKIDPPKVPESAARRQHSNSEQVQPKVEPMARIPSAQQFASPKIVPKPQEARSKPEQFLPKDQQNSKEQIHRPPTAPKEFNKAVPNQRPQSSRPIVSQPDKQKQKIVVEKKRPISVDKQQNKPQTNVQRDNVDKQRQEERIKLLKEKQIEQIQLKEKQEKEKQQREQQSKDIQLKEIQQKKDQQLKEQQRKIEQQNYQQQQEKEKIQQQIYQKEQQQLLKQQQQQQQLQQKQSPKISNKAESPGIQKKQAEQYNKKSKEGQFLLDQMQEKNKEFELMLKELEDIISGVNSAVDKLPNQQNGKENIFDQFNTALINQQQLAEDREDDEDEPDLGKENVKKDQMQNKVTKEDEECLEALQCNNKISTLKITLERAMGGEKFLKAFQVLKDQITKHDLEYIEKKHGPKYEQLLPFLNQNERKNYVPLLFTYIISECQGQ